jgi:hypothetical protein
MDLKYKGLLKGSPVLFSYFLPPGAGFLWCQLVYFIASSLRRTLVLHSFEQRNAYRHILAVTH